MTAFLIIPLAFLLGFALVRVATCTVAATMRWVGEGRLDWLFGLLIIAAWSGLILFLLVQYSGRAHIPLDVEIGWQLFAGAAIMGLGALVNRGCFVGTVGYIGTGKFGYLLTFVGLAVAILVLRIEIFDPFDAAVTVPRVAVEDSMVKQAAIFMFTSLCLFSLWMVVMRRDRAMLALLTIGICAALIFGTRPEWAYAAVLNALLAGQGLSVGITIELAVAALFGGAIVSSWLRDKFNPQLGTWRQAGTYLLGGFLMGIGAALVPGGNDVLLMWTVPGLAFYGVIAYLVMVATIAVAGKFEPIVLAKLSSLMARRNAD